MKRATQISLMRRLLAAAAGEETPLGGTTVLDVGRYLDPQELSREQRVLFRERPVVVAHVGELADPGAFVTAEVGGMPLVAVRDGDSIRVLSNACQHRGARVLTERAGCARALTCPYHAWTYRLDGSLLHVPHQETFGGGFDPTRYGLPEVPSTTRHGFVWVQVDGAASPDVAAFLGPTLDDDFEALDLGAYRVRKRIEHHRGANWKLVMDAFAEGYHLTSLHRRSVARFFIDAAILDDCSPHVRQVGARRTLRELQGTPESEWDFFATTTLFYNLFPNSVLVFHPDWLSHLVLEPDGVARVKITHRMLVRDDLAGETASGAHLDESFALIDGRVFQQEDFAIAESVQSTLASGAARRIVTGGLERGMQLFHRARDLALHGGG